MRQRPTAKKRPVTANNPDYPDDPAGVMSHAGKYRGGKALIVLGGYSALNWIDAYNVIKPDVILGANGVNAVITGLDYWLCSENMNYTNALAQKGDSRARKFMTMFHRHAGAKTKLISHWSWGLLKDRENCISIRRMGYEYGHIPDTFSLREYGEGLMAGWVYRDSRAVRLAQRVGTVGSQLLHLAGILGCAEVHTIGFDMIFLEKDRHHWYGYPVYKVDYFRRPGAFIEYKGIQTQRVWVESARFLKSVEPYFERDGLKWIDHSKGLLSIEGLKCATWRVKS